MSLLSIQLKVDSTIISWTNCLVFNPDLTYMTHVSLPLKAHIPIQLELTLYSWLCFTSVVAEPVFSNLPTLLKSL